MGPQQNQKGQKETFGTSRGSAHPPPPPLAPTPGPRLPAWPRQPALDFLGDWQAQCHSGVVNTPPLGAFSVDSSAATGDALLQSQGQVLGVKAEGRAAGPQDGWEVTGVPTASVRLDTVLVIHFRSTEPPNSLVG